LNDLENKEQNITFSEATNYILPMLDFLPKDYSVPLKLTDIDNYNPQTMVFKLVEELNGESEALNTELINKYEQGK
jgi:hypothetical protein